MSESTPPDTELLRQYAAGSESAFRELVSRHVGLVQATARRVLSSAPHLADDVTQHVFTDLAKMAATLSPNVVLAGWLHRHSYYLALNVARAEHRRQARERTAMEIHAVNDDSTFDAQWAQLAPVLDEALNRLDPPDRDAIVLRYLQQSDLRNVGAALGLSEDSAQKRVSRALDKLRGILSQRGVTLASVAGLASTLEASPSPPVTPGLSTTISDRALSGTSAVGTMTFALNYLKNTITLKTILGLAAAVAVIGIATVILTRNSPTTASAVLPSKILIPVVKSPAVMTVVTPPRQSNPGAMVNFGAIGSSGGRRGAVSSISDPVSTLITIPDPNQMISVNIPGSSIQDVLQWLQMNTGKTIMAPATLPGAQISFSTVTPEPRKDVISAVLNQLSNQGIILSSLDSNTMRADSSSTRQEPATPVAMPNAAITVNPMGNAPPPPPAPNFPSSGAVLNAPEAVNPPGAIDVTNTAFISVDDGYAKHVDNGDGTETDTTWFGDVVINPISPRPSKILQNPDGSLTMVYPNGTIETPTPPPPPPPPPARSP